MSAFAGIVTFDGAPVHQQMDDDVCRALTAARKERIVALRIPGAVYGQRVSVAGTGGPSDRQPVTSRNGRTLFAALARLDNREELGAALTIPPAELARTPDGALLLGMHERWGDAGLARCLGAFSFALWDADVRRLTLGRDCLGNRSLFYHCGQGFVAFATTLGTLLALRCVPRAIDEITLANFMVANVGEARRTFYRGIERVPSRTLVTIDRAGASHRHYWVPDLYARPPYRRAEDYVERARELLDQAVGSAITDTPHVAISSSGGLDSSAIAATAARLGRARRIACYTIVPPLRTQIDVGPFRYLDERDKVEALGRMYPVLELRFIAPERLHPFEEDDTRYFARAGMPSLAPTTLGTYNYLYQAVAAAGHRALLIGNFGNFGLTWQGSFSLLALLRSRSWGAFARELPALARQTGRGTVRTFAGEVVMPAVPVPLRRLIYRLRGRDPDSAARFSALNPAFVAEMDLARDWQERGFDPWFGASGWDPARHRAHYMFDHNQLARDAKAMCDERHGFEVRDPHADRRLLEFVLTVPEHMFRRNGVARSFAREVLSDRLPHNIFAEHRLGAQSPTWFRRLDARRTEIAAEIEQLDASPLARRLIDVARLKGLVAQWPKDEHAAERRRDEYALALARGVHVGRFVRWVEGGNA